MVMSDYKIVNGKRVRECKYECGQTVAYDEENKYMIEVDNDNVHHTPERCKAFKEINQDPNKKKAVETIKQIEETTNNNSNSRQITLEMVTKKLESLGIIINVERLMSQ